MRGAENVKSIFFFNDTATTEIYTLSLHDALPICRRVGGDHARSRAPLNRSPSSPSKASSISPAAAPQTRCAVIIRDRKSTRLNSSHANNSYAVFCLKKILFLPAARSFSYLLQSFQ